MSLNKHIILIMGLFLFHSTASALDFGLGFGYSEGGETLVEVTNASNFNLGDGLTISLDAKHAITESLELQGSIGYKFENPDIIILGKQVNFRLNTVPVFLGLRYNLNKKIGVDFGGTKILSGTLSAQVVGSSFSETDLESNFDTYFGLSYKLNRKLTVGVRYISSFEINSTTAGSTALDAKHLTFFTSSYF